MVVATGVFAEPVREDDHAARCATDVCGGPDVIDDAHTVDTLEG
jgi:hypothetical protein